MKKILLSYKSLINLQFVFIAALVVFFTNANLHANNVNQAKAFAGFIKHIYASTSTNGNGNSLCLFGSDSISLEIIAASPEGLIKKIGEDVVGGKDYKKCRVIYIAKNKQKDARGFSNLFGVKGILTIATFPSFVVDGGMIYIGVGRRNFELTINEALIKRVGIMIDPSITSLIVI